MLIDVCVSGADLDRTADAEIDRAKRYGRAAKADRTIAEYARDWRDFERYCRARGLSALPADPLTVARYAATLAGVRAIATIRRRMIAISQAHQERGFEPPTAHKVVREVLAGIAHTHGSAQQKSALTLDLLRAALLTIDETTLKGKRDRALLLLGFAGAFRRGELAALDVEHLAFDGRGLTITLPHSKTDQEGAGREVAIPYVRAAGMCAARAVRSWLDAAAIGDGPVFRTFSLPRGRHTAGDSVQAQRIDGRDVARILQRSTARAQLEGNFSAHSLRAGFITSAAQKKIPEADVQRVSGHRSVATLRSYIRRATIFEDSPLTAIIDAP